MTFFDGRRDRLEKFRVGDREVLSELFTHYVDEVTLVLRLGFRLDAKQVHVRGVGAPERLKELVQEVFMRAMAPRAREAFNGLQPYRPYLLQIARNLLIDEHRGKGRPFQQVSQAELDSAPSLEPAADDALELEAMRKATAEYTRGLSEQLREFVAIRFEQGLSQAASGNLLGVSRRMIRGWEETVQEGLRRHLEALGFKEE